ncbi:MAG TPA: hypothetical protein VFA85_03545 [Terriglobales bacterium]|nr:hypothetical protein [Terriglobales bacterium]
MRRRSIFLVVMLAAVVVNCRADVLDRTVASVNGHVILFSDWNDEMRFECFASGGSVADLTAEEKQAALQRLIDQELLKEQLRLTDERPVEEEKLEKQIASLKDDYLRQHPGESWETALAKYHLSAKFIRNHVASELQELQLIDARFRPSAQVSAAEIDSYYKDQFVPKLPASDPVSLPDATPKIREILVQGKIDQMLSSWLQTLRSQAQIRIVPDSARTETMPPQVPAP